jgi:hypothetical protein
MKNVFFAIAFMLLGTFAFANNNEKVDKETKLESAKVEYITIDSNCYVRWCWLEGTTKKCTPWNQVPCDKGFSTETLEPSTQE